MWISLWLAAALSWTAPTQNCDGTLLTNLSGFEVRQRCSTIEPPVYDEWNTIATLPSDASSYNVGSIVPPARTCQWTVVSLASDGTNSDGCSPSPVVGKSVLEPPGDAIAFYEWSIDDEPEPEPDPVTVAKGTVGGQSTDFTTSGSWTHTGTANAKGIVVFVSSTGQADDVTSVTAASNSMGEVTGSPLASVTAGGDAHNLSAWFLSGDFSSNATIQVNGGSNNKRGFSVSVTASASATQVNATNVDISSDSLINPSDTLALGGVPSFVVMGLVSGASSIGTITPLSGWTSDREEDQGSFCSAMYTYDTVGSSDVTIGWTQNADDATAIAIAISEVSGGAVSMDMSAATFNIDPANPSWTGKYTGALTAKAFAITPVNLAWSLNFTNTLTTPSFDFSAQPLSWTAHWIWVLSARAFSMTGQSLSWLANWIWSLSASVFNFTSQNLSYATGFLAQLNSSTFNFTGQSPSWIAKWNWELSASSFSISPEDLEYTAGSFYLAALTASVFNMTPQNVTWAGKYIVALSSAAMSFIGRVLTWTDGGATPETAVDLFHRTLIQPTIRKIRRAIDKYSED